MEIFFNKKNYKIFWIGNIISIKKRKGYGKYLVKCMKNFLKTKETTGLGFCKNEITGFYKSAGLDVIKDLARRFRYIDSKGKQEELKEDDDGIYFEGKGTFIKEISKKKSEEIILLPFY